MRTPRLCVYCRKELHWRQRADARYCSGACRTKAYRGRRQVCPISPVSREVIEEDLWPDGWPSPQPYYPGWGLEWVTFNDAVKCNECHRTMVEGILATVLLPTGLKVETGLFCGDDCLLDVFV